MFLLRTRSNEQNKSIYNGNGKEWKGVRRFFNVYYKPALLEHSSNSSLLNIGLDGISHSLSDNSSASKGLVYDIFVINCIKF